MLTKGREATTVLTFGKDYWVGMSGARKGLTSGIWVMRKVLVKIGIFRGIRSGILRFLPFTIILYSFFVFRCRFRIYVYLEC